MKRIGTLIAPFVKNLGIEGALTLEVIRREWANIFSEPLSLHICPSHLHNGELLIHVDSPVWLQQISLYKADIIEKLHPYEVKDIRFRLGRVRPGNRSVNPHPASTIKPSQPALDGKALAFIEHELAGVTNAELRDSIRRAMEKVFSMKTKERGKRDR